MVRLPSEMCALTISVPLRNKIYKALFWNKTAVLNPVWVRDWLQRWTVPASLYRAWRWCCIGNRYAGALCGNFLSKLFTTTVVRTRWKNAGTVGLASNPCFAAVVCNNGLQPCFGQQANAALATVASSRVIELSKQPARIGCKFVMQGWVGFSRCWRRVVIFFLPYAERLKDFCHYS